MADVKIKVKVNTREAEALAKLFESVGAAVELATNKIIDAERDRCLGAIDAVHAEGRQSGLSTQAFQALEDARSRIMSGLCALSEVKPKEWPSRCMKCDVEFTRELPQAVNDGAATGLCAACYLEQLGR